VLSSTGSGPGYDSVFSVVLMRALQRSDAGCKFPPPTHTHTHSRPPFFFHALFLSISGPYLDVSGDRIVCDGSVVTTTRVSMGVVVVFFYFSVAITVFVRWFSLFLPSSVFFLHQFTEVQHLVSAFSLVFVSYFTATSILGVNGASSQRSRWFCALFGYNIKGYYYLS